MPNDVATSDPLAWLVQALEPELSKVEASAEFVYSSADRGSLTINRHGKAMQTSYFASFELQALRDGGVGALEKQKTALLDQIHRLLNPPKPSPISLAGMMPARRGRTAAKKGNDADGGGGESGGNESGGNETEQEESSNEE